MESDAESAARTKDESWRNRVVESRSTRGVGRSQVIYL